MRSMTTAHLRSFVAAFLAGAAILVVPAPEFADAQEPVDIVGRSIELHGGDLYESSAVELRLCSGSGCYDLAVTRRDGVYRHRVAGPVRAGHREVEATNDTVRHWLDGVEMPVTDARAEQGLRDWATARIYFAFLPFRLDDPSAQREDLGQETWGDRELHKVKVTFRAGTSTDAEDEYLYWFDPATARLEQFAYSFEGNPGGLRFRRLDNYRRVGGILFFDQKNLGVEGDDLSVDQIDPEFVEERMRHVSDVRLEIVSVGPSSRARG